MELFESALREMVGKSFFISKYGEIISANRHIQLILDNPKDFGFTKDDLNRIYDKYKEKPGQEGIAREEIIKKVIERGWIRVRKYNRPEYWSINVYLITKDIAKRLENLAKQISEKNIDRHGNLWDEIRILETKTNKIFTYTVKDIMEFKLFKDLFENVETGEGFELEECTMEEYREKRALYHCTIEEYREKEERRQNNWVLRKGLK